MKRATKIQFLPCSKKLRKVLHDMDCRKCDQYRYLFDLSKQMERDVPRPPGFMRNGRWEVYNGP